MFQTEESELERLGAKITVHEIKQQPKLWAEVFQNYLEIKDNIYLLLNQLKEFPKVRVIFTGAGTSAYIGDTLLPYLRNQAAWNFTFESIPTTEIVTNPYQVFKKEIPTLLVSFARSGNSPESLAAVHLGTRLVDDFYQLNITCAPDGNLAQKTRGSKNAYLFLMPPDSNDKGFAMTGSFTCMMLSALLIFGGISDEQNRKNIKTIIEMGREVIEKEEAIQSLVNRDFNRIAYLGSGVLAALTREAQLKILELTAGRIATIFDSSMGFRHGPKSFVNEKTAVFVFTSNNLYTRQYDVDMLEELKRDGTTDMVVSIGTPQELNYSGNKFYFKSGENLEDIYLVFPFIMVAQTIAVLSSLKVGNTPDTPSATGTVNRVVKGVTIHSYETLMGR